jgi:flagellar motor switch/type III secretory pathway protein FliN
MSEPGLQLAADLLSACQLRGGELIETLASVLGWREELQAGEISELEAAAVSTEMGGPGVLLLAHVGDAAVVLALPEAGGLLPDWTAKAAEDVDARLSDLPKQLADVLGCESSEGECRAARVDDLAQALLRGQLAPESKLTQIPICQGDQEIGRVVVGALPRPDEAVREAAGQQDPLAGGASTPSTEASAAPSLSRDHPLYSSLEEGLRLLPGYSRSLLKIRLPLVVKLACSKQPLGRILELGPGSIIQFDKSCEETLTLEIGDQEIALGEAVKVGEKFGLRITSMIMPEERFRPVEGRKT